MKYRTRRPVAEPIQWFKNGDHPQDNCETFIGSDGKPFQGEGEVVRYYRTPELDGKNECPKCGKIMHLHGWLETRNKVICPGDWLIIGRITEVCEEIN